MFEEEGSARMTVRRTAKTKDKDPALDMKNTRRAIPRLTPRERQVLSLVAHGYTSKQIGEKLGISPRTAETHRVNIGRRLGIRNVAQMVRYAIENKL
jgi:DNA-binding NarL/FixJ family response regulator